MHRSTFLLLTHFIHSRFLLQIFQVIGKSLQPYTFQQHYWQIYDNYTQKFCLQCVHIFTNVILHIVYLFFRTSLLNHLPLLGFQYFYITLYFQILPIYFILNSYQIDQLLMLGNISHLECTSIFIFVLCMSLYTVLFG